MHRNALAIQVTSEAAGLRHPIPIGLIVDHEKGIDPDDGIDLVAVLIVRSMFEADPVDAAVVVIPGRTHAHALGLAKFGVFGMAGNLVTLDDDNSLDRGLCPSTLVPIAKLLLLNLRLPVPLLHSVC